MYQSIYCVLQPGAHGICIPTSSQYVKLYSNTPRVTTAIFVGAVMAQQEELKDNQLKTNPY
jgi:purine-nucleoside phosphorylase